MRNLFISFSGGETSGYMTWMLIKKYRAWYKDVVVGFANTGQEHEATLEFIRRCDQAFGFGTIWVEAVVHPISRIGTTHRVVSFETANRDGGPYETAIRKFGIPNAKFPHCTRELKERPLTSLIRSLGWKSNSYDLAIGIRADEAERRNTIKPHIMYPLLDWEPTTKADVGAFWGRQSFRLNLAGYRGNCQWCWKKSNRKLLQIMDEAPHVFDFPERMEREYAMVGPEFKKATAPGYKRTFFRGNNSVADLKVMHAKGQWSDPDPAVAQLDWQEEPGCAEHCEVTL